MRKKIVLPWLVMAQIMFDLMSGHGLNTIYERYGKRLGVSKATLYRRIVECTLWVYATVDELFRNSHLGKIKMKLGRTWQLDEKIEPVNADVWQSSGNVIHSYKNKDSRFVAQIMICNILAIARKYKRKKKVIDAPFVLVSDQVGKGTTEDIAQALLKAKLRAGKWPAELQFDKAASHKRAHVRYFRKKFSRRTLPKIGELSQLYDVEGFHNGMERKLLSGIHGRSLWLIYAHWLHKNFVERKPRLGLTPFEHAIDWRTPGSNGWEWLLRLAQHYEKEKVRTRREAKANGILETPLPEYKFRDWINKGEQTYSDAVVTLLYDLNIPLTTNQIAQILCKEWKRIDVRNVSKVLTTRNNELQKNGYICRDPVTTGIMLTEEGRRWYEKKVLPKLKRKRRR